MAEKKNGSLSRPEVNVKLPEVRLSLKDLAYLRSLTQSQAVRCYPGKGTLDKLRFLDLVARAKVGPSAAKIADAAEKRAALLTKLNDAMLKEDWEAAYNHSYSLKKLVESLNPVEDDVLTDKGKKLLQQSEVVVRVRKAGCI